MGAALVLMAIFNLALMLGIIFLITTVIKAVMSNLTLTPCGPYAFPMIPLIHAMIYPLLVTSTLLVFSYGMELVMLVFDKRFVNCFLLVDFLKDSDVFLAHIRIVKLVFD